MGNLILDMSMSLDGFISGENDGLQNWVFNGSVPLEVGGFEFHMASETSAKVLKAFVDSVGAFLVGNGAYSAFAGNPIFGKPTFVLTHTPHETLHPQGTTITFVTDGIEDALKQAKAAAGDKHVSIFGGGNVAQQYLRAGLVDEIHINLVPKLLGGGMRLFEDNLPAPVDMECTSVIPATGVTHVQYRLLKKV